MRRLKGWAGVVLMLIGAGATAGQTLTRVRVETADAVQASNALMGQGFDIIEGSVTAEAFEAVVSSDSLTLLIDQGFAPQVVEIGQPFREVQAVAERAAEITGPTVTPLAMFTGYLDLAGIEGALNATAAAYPEICRVVDLTVRYNKPATANGRHLYAVKISNHAAEEKNKPAYLLIANHHAREIVTPVIALYAVQQLTSGYGSNPVLTALVDQYEIWVAPTWNPDGYVYVFDVDNLWRKNRRPFPTSVGVDLNRNYPFGWTSPCDGSTQVNNETYRGPTAASEAEVQTMLAWAADRRFAKVVDLHSYGRQVRYGYGCWSYPFMSFLAAEAGSLAAMASGYAPALSCCTGGEVHFQMGWYGAAAFLWETHTQFQPSYSSALAEATRVFPSMVALWQRPIPLSGQVIDALSGLPLAATITLKGVNFTNGETNSSGGPFGRYQAFLPSGTYAVEFSATNYLTQTHVVNITADSAQELDVALWCATCRQPGDADGNYAVDLFDFARLSRYWLTTGCGSSNQWCQGADLNHDGNAGLGDLVELAEHWLQGK
jgi:hypothetical protein